MPVRVMTQLNHHHSLSAGERAILRAAPAAEPVSATLTSTQARPSQAAGLTGSPSASAPAMTPMQGTM